MFKNISRSNSHYSQTSFAQITYDDNKISFVIKKRKNKKTKNKWRKGRADEKETRRNGQNIEGEETRSAKQASIALRRKERGWLVCVWKRRGRRRK